MRKMKKPLALLIALTLVLTMATATMSASALKDINGDGKIGLGLVQGFFDSLKGSKDDTTAPDVSDTSTGDSTTTTKREPLINFYIDYDVVKNLEWGFSIGKKPTTTTTTTTTVEEITDPSTPLAPAPSQEAQTTAAPSTTQLQVVVNDSATPKGDIPSTGDAGIAAVATLTAVSAAAFVFAKKAKKD